jgi:hypothetical protein
MMHSLQVTEQKKHVNISATATLPISAAEAFELHVQERHASRFRDIKKYAEYLPTRNGTIIVGFPGGMGCPIVRMILSPRQSKDEFTVDFHSEDSCLLDIVGRWTLTPVGSHTCHVALAQSMRFRLPIAEILIPLKRIATRRISRCMEDTISYAQQASEERMKSEAQNKNIGSITTNTEICSQSRVADWLSSQFSSS